MALRQNPLVHQAMADVQAARGAAIQAGALPNPSVSFQEDNVNTGGTAGYQGVGISQTIPTGGKLALARRAANVEVQNAELTLRRTRNELVTQVRSNYYAVLVARERIKVNRALSEFAEKVYRAQIGRTKTGQAAPYEPLQLRVLVLQARAQLIQSQNEYGAAWRRLAATLSTPEMCPVELAGDVNISVPNLDQQAAWQWICDHHTNLIIAQNGVAKSQHLLQLAKMTPWIPDINVDASIQHDNTVAPYGTAYNLHAGIPIPLFDRNRGNIMSADAALMRASARIQPNPQRACDLVGRCLCPLPIPTCPFRLLPHANSSGSSAELSCHLPAIPAGRRHRRFQRCRYISADISLGGLDVHSSPGRSVAIGG